MFWGGGPTNDSTEEKLRRFEEELGSCKQALAEQREEYREAIRKLTAQVEKVGIPEDPKDEALDNASSDHEFKPTMPSEVTGDVAAYQLASSIWDAAVLSFFSEIGLVEKVTLFFGVVLNFSLQGLMLWCIAFDMLEDPYPPQKVKEMLAWRIESGHADGQFNQMQGKSRIESLCNQELWGFEQEEYNEMYNYLYMPVPGIMLSLLALILWVLTTMREYRNTVEQALAILTLPCVKAGQPCMEHNDGEVHITGMRWASKVLAFLVLTLPRLGITFVICYMGCQYLAHTASLQDIVLNAVALAFVLEIDELLYDVICTESIREVIDKVKPLPCSRRTKNKKWYTSLPKDLLRYSIAIGMIIFSYFYLLVPFRENVAGAANALCGGKYDFSYTGGTASAPTIWLQNSSGYDGPTGCSGTTFDTYLTGNYLKGKSFAMNLTRKPARAPPTPDYSTLREQHVLNYALKGCPPGSILEPLKAHNDVPPERQCIEVPAKMTEMLPPEVKPGGAPDPARCSQFKPGPVATACQTLPADGQACLWDHASADCEFSPPGTFHINGCPSVKPPSQDLVDVDKTCDVWQMFGFEASPDYNCRARDVCDKFTPGSYNCLGVSGEVVVDHWALGLSNSTLQVVGLSLQDGTGCPLTGPDGVSWSPLARRLGKSSTQLFSMPWNGGPSSPAQPANSSRTTVYFRLGPCPVTFVPEMIFTSNETDLLQASIAKAERMSSAPQVAFSNMNFIYDHSWQQRGS